jgi:HPt (histidine-containing phosphotransfer) domain-containing protein
MRPLVSSASSVVDMPPEDGCAAMDAASKEVVPMDGNGDQPAINYPELLNRFEGERDLLREVICIFLSERRRRSQRLRHAVRHNDREALALAAHSFAGCLSTFAAGRATTLARELEYLARSGDSCKAGSPVYDAFNQELGRVVRALQAIAHHAGSEPK